MNGRKLLDEVYKIVQGANSKLMYIWIEQILFSWRWWLELILTIVPWLIWVRYRNKKDTARLLFVGLIVAITTNTFDNIGLTFNSWHYDWKTFPFIPIYTPWDFALFPVTVMFFLQVKPTVKPLYKAIIFGIYSAYICEPLFYWLGLYDPVNWRHWYSTVIYFFLYQFYNYIYNSKLLIAYRND